MVFNLFDPRHANLIGKVEEALPLMRFYRSLSLNALDEKDRRPLLEFILDNYESRNHKMDLLPFVERNEYYVLIIPMDEETPPGRYLRPQAMAEEYITRNWAYPVSFRLDLTAARSTDEEISTAERQRFDEFIANFKKRPRAVITDSQAMDVMVRWMPDDIRLTTFSIMMINYVSRGRLKSFADGIRALDRLAAGEKVLIVEACNHSRVGEDIGTVQIPRFIAQHYPGVVVEHNFGREFQENSSLQEYRLMVHCGGCMISAQKLAARIRDLETVGVPYTNYGIFLSYMQGEDALRRVLEPWGLAGP